MFVAFLCFVGLAILYALVYDYFLYRVIRYNQDVASREPYPTVHNQN